MTIGMDRPPEVGEARRVGSHDEDVVGEWLQRPQLSNDDGMSLDDEATLVLASEATGSASRKDGGGRRGRTRHDPIMTEVRIDRLLAACLHQAIAEGLPDRLEFYEHWLSSAGMRDGRIGAARMLAVVGFLRTEGPAYDRVMERAGRLASAWTIGSLSQFRRRTMAWLPRPLRARMALRLAASIVRTLSRTSRATARCAGAHGRLEIASSLFCDVRGAQAAPLCRFYLALAVEALGQFDIDAAGVVARCHAVEGSTCLITLEFTRAAAGSPAAAA